MARSQRMQNSCFVYREARLINWRVNSLKRRQDGHRMRINRLSFWDSISVWISSLSRSRIGSRLKFLVSEIGTLLCFPLSYDYWISFSPPLLFFPLLSSFFFLPFFHSARRKCKCIVTELLFQFFWLSSSRKYVDVEIEWI